MEIVDQRDSAEIISDWSCSVNRLLEDYDRMVIPHFQRGLVWEESSIALLLESLYFGTPCGSIILWQPGRASDHGVPLGSQPEYLIIDGQQRIRSLSEVFLREQSPEDVWCLNLARLPEFDGQFENRFRLFGRHRNPLTQQASTAEPRDLAQRRALLPLSWVVKGLVDQQNLLADSAGTVAAEAVTKVLATPHVLARLSGMRDDRLFAIHLFGVQHSLTDVVKAYNRINSAGKRVEAEERLFARLVSVFPETERKLEAFFAATHKRFLTAVASPSDPHQAAIDARDDLVGRERENAFGFKLFMRAFVIAFSYHTDRGIGSSSFSFNAVDHRDLERGSAFLNEVLDLTTNTLSTLARIIRNQHCDDFRMLPETSSLWPVLQAMFRFPTLAQSQPEQLGGIVLRLMLAGLPDRDLLDLVTRINEARDSEAALAVFDRELNGRRVRSAIRRGIRRSQSVNSRYVLMLYWLLRRKNAIDFSYDKNLEPDYARELRRLYATPAEPLISAEVSPQRQHIVPVGYLKTVFRDLGASRLSRHESNSLGNLTHISKGLNGWKGLSAALFDLRGEPEPNRRAHFLAEGGVMEAFERIREKPSKSKFRKFCRARNKQIEESFAQWNAESARRRPARAISEAPTRRLIAPTLQDRLRDLGYSPELSERLVGIVDRGFEEWKSKKAADSDELRLALLDSKGRQRMRVVLVSGGATVRVRVWDARLRNAFGKEFPDLRHAHNTKVGGTFDLAQGTAVRRVAKIMDWFLARIPTPKRR